MPRLKRAEEEIEDMEDIPTLAATRSRRTIKPNPKYMDSVVIPSKHSSPENSDAETEDEYPGNEDDDDDDDLKELEILEKIATPIRGRTKVVQKQTPLSELKRKIMKTTDCIIPIMDFKKNEQRMLQSKKVQEMIAEKRNTPVRPLRNNPIPERKTSIITPVRKAATIIKSVPSKKPKEVYSSDDENEDVEMKEVSKKSPLQKKSTLRLEAKKPDTKSKRDEEDSSDATDEEKETRTTRSGAPILRKLPAATSTPKPRITVKSKEVAAMKKDKVNPLEGDDNDDEKDDGEKEESVQIVNIKEIMRNKVPVSTTPLKRTPIVTTILDRKRYQKDGAGGSPPFKVQKLEDGRKPNTTQLVRFPQKSLTTQVKIAPKKPVTVASFDLSRESDEKIDFEEVLTKSIVRPSDKEKIITPRTIKSARRRVSEHSEPDESEVKTKKPAVPSTTVNNNVIIKPNNNNGNLIKKPAPQIRTPPRILNASLNRSNRSLNASGNTDDSNFSIELSDNDNNVKLIAAKPKSVATGQKKTVILNAQNAPMGLRNNSNIINKTSSMVQTPPSAAAKGTSKTKKITCFETWYVISIPEDEPYMNERGVLEMSLMTLGNRAAAVKLPTKDWSYKITLIKRKNMKKNGEESYTGEVQEANIEDSEKHKYEPFNIMFRRKARSAMTNNPLYDRAVVFKHRSFFLNIQGKCVRLIGAPQTVEKIEDVQTLLSIVDSVTLKSQLVELTTLSP